MYEFPVFQAGHRECLGREMALFETKLVTTMLIQRYSFTIDPTEAEKITYSLMITMSIQNSELKSKLNGNATFNLWVKPGRRT